MLFDQDPSQSPIPPEPPATPDAPTGAEAAPAPPRPPSTSRWIDYDSHELMQMINDLEDERRWARLREGIWIALIVHMLLISAITWIPKYVLKVPQVVDPLDAIRKRKDLSYLDLPPDALRQAQPKMKVQPVPLKKPPVIDSKTLDEIKRYAPPTPAPQPQQPPQPSQLQSPVQPPPQQQQQAQVEAPHPSAVPAHPSLSMGSGNPASQLRDAMRGATRGGLSGGRGTHFGSGSGSGRAMPQHPSAGGGVEILSDTQGVDFSNWLQRWHYETQHTWDPLIPDEVNPPISKSGWLAIRFKVLPNGRIMEGSMMLVSRSGDTALDRAAWGALTGSNYPPLPRDFHGPFLELQANFYYNENVPH